MRILAVPGIVLGLVLPCVGSAQTRPATSEAVQAASPFHEWRTETWFYFRNNSESSDYSQQGKATLRFYQPIRMDGGWLLTLREDIPGIHTNQIGEDNRNARWLTNIGDVFVQGSLATPAIHPGVRADLGLRVVFPTGGLKPFGDGYYQLAPHFGFDWKDAVGIGWLDFAPLARYFRSVGAPVPHGTEISQLQVHPIVTMRLGERWSISIWDENPIVYDALTTGWFVPIDAYLSFRPVPGFSVAVGGSVRTYGSYAQYDNMIYSRLRVSF